MSIVIAILLSYLLGAVPFGLIIAKAHHIDLRSIGSGNIGATNVSRALGKKWGYGCFLLDVFKGFIPTALCLVVIKSRAVSSGFTELGFLWLWLVIGCASIAGHIFPIYTGGKGGKGVATSFGVALGLWPYFTGCAVLALLTWVIIVFMTRYVSLASVMAAVSFPIYFVVAISFIENWTLKTLWPLQVIAVLIPVVVTLRHRENLGRILSGTENKITDKS